ncbi:hypothetical protein FDENT_10592 [Fusarium denticulatum]|uniref:Uncharacterized protein n=1 Tax=Fusarium denticulatum TaxID=48507 RepID=A0A8H5TMZ5_9HYPO|nr:hypothetical protein FDENT_10592 [Fusarium denticulatum]
MLESSDYLRFDLEHPRQAAFVRLFVEDDLASTGTAFKFKFVDFRDSTAAKKYVANVKPDGLEQSTQIKAYPNPKSRKFMSTAEAERK